MNSNCLVVDNSSNINLVIKQSLQLTQRIKFTCFDVSKTYIVFGATSGGLYVFNRQPHHFIKLIPTNEGSVVQVCISPDERHIGLSTSKGIIIIIQNCFLESNIHYNTYTEHRNSIVTAMKWYMDELFCGDNVGKTTVITLPSLLAKAIFQVTCATLMHLESTVVQIDVFLKYILISTLTKTYICDTDKEQYRQIGKKLRNGRYGGCFAINNLDTNVVSPEIFSNKGAYRKFKDDQQFVSHINDNIQIFCSRPGARMWEAKLNASVTRTHQFKSLLVQKPNDVIKMNDNCDLRLTICPNDDLKMDDTSHFTKVYTFENKYILTFSKGGFYLFDPKAVTMICWCNYYKNIKDLKIVDNFIYILDDDVEIHVIGIYTLEKIILKTLFDKQYYMCADLCAHYIKNILDLIESSKNIHLISVLNEKLGPESDTVLQKLSPIFNAMKNATDKTYTTQKLKTGIVMVNPFNNPPENKHDKEHAPETFQRFKDLGTTITVRLTESSKNLKDKFQILENTFKSLALNDGINSNGPTVHADSTNINNNDDPKETENDNIETTTQFDDPEVVRKIFIQQRQLTAINRNLESPKFYELLEKHDLNAIMELFINFSASKKNGESLKLWCYFYYLRYLSKINFKSILEASKAEDAAAIKYAHLAFCDLNASKCKCPCSFPLPSAKNKVPDHYDIGCILLKKFWKTNRQLVNEITNKVPYMWKYVLQDLKANDSICEILPLLIQFSDQHLIGVFASKIKYDEWDEAIKLFIKLQKHTCVNCDKKFDKRIHVPDWSDFGTVLINGAGPQNTISLLKRYASIIPSSELGLEFYQKCIFAAVIDNSYDGLRTRALDFVRAMHGTKRTLFEFDGILKKFLQEQRLIYSKKKNGFQNSKTEYSCSFCDLPVEIPLLKNGIRLSCDHIYHSICLNYNRNVCPICS